MKLQADSRPGAHVIAGYGPGYVAVGSARLTRSFLVLPERLDDAWGPEDFAGLAVPHLEVLAGLKVDVLLLGTGARQRFPAPALLRPLIEAGVAVEIMDTPAACRTYNIILGEGRLPAAALIVE